MISGYRTTVFIAVFLGFTSVFGGAWNTAQSETVQLVTGNQFPPYADQRLPDGGLATAVVRAVYARMGKRIEVAHLDWEDGLARTEAGQFFGTFPYIKAGDRVERFFFSDPIFSVRPRLFVHFEIAAFINEVEDMEGRTLCVPDSWAVDQYLRGMVKNGQISKVTGRDIVDCFQKVFAREADGVSVDRQLGSMAASRVDGSAWTKNYNFAPFPAPNYLIVSRSYPGGARLLLEFNKALQSMQDDGYINVIVDRFYDKYAN